MQQQNASHVLAIVEVFVCPSLTLRYCVKTAQARIKRSSLLATIRTLVYLTLPPGWTGSYTCPALRPYQLGPMHVSECDHKVTGSDYKAVDGCEAVNRRL